MSNADIYINKYKELEATVRSVYRLAASDSITYCLKNRAEFRKYRDDIVYCQEVRNILQHKTTFSGSYAVEPSDSMIEFIDSLIVRIRKRPKCLDYAVMMKDVYWRSHGDNVKVVKADLVTCIWSFKYDSLGELNNGETTAEVFRYFGVLI